MGNLMDDYGAKQSGDGIKRDVSVCSLLSRTSPSCLLMPYGAFPLAFDRGKLNHAVLISNNSITSVSVVLGGAEMDHFLRWVKACSSLF